MTTHTIVTALSHWLAEGDELDRCCAAQTLGKLKDKQAVVPLLARLEDEDVDVVLDAIVALGQLRQSAGVTPLLTLLKEDPEGEIKAAALDALIALADPQIIPTLLALAVGRPTNMQWEGDGEWDIWWDLQLTAIKALGQLQVVDAVPVLTELLGSAEVEDIEGELCKALASLGEPGYAVLEQQLRTAQLRTRRRAAQALGSPKTSTTLRTAIVHGLTDSAPEVRIATVESLGSRGGGAYYETLLRMLKDDSPAVQQATLHALAQLTPYIRQRDWDWQTLLTVLTSDTDAVVLTETLKIVADLAAELPEEGWSAVANCLTSPYPAVRQAACAVYVSQQDVQVQPVLLELLMTLDYDVVVRSEAALALGALGQSNPEVLTALTAAIESPLQSLCFAALRALMALAAVAPATVAASAPVPEASLTPDSTAAVTSTDDAWLSPLQRVIATLQGETVLLTDTSITADDASQSSQSNVAAVTATPDAVHRGDAENIGEANLSSPSAPVPEFAPPQSTLEAIQQNNLAAAKALRNQATIATAAAEPLPTAVAPFKQLADESIALGERLFVRRKINVAQDVRLLSARVLATSDAPEVITALLSPLTQADWELQYECTTALEHIFQRNPPAAMVLTQALAQLSPQLEHTEWSLRLATVRTLGVLPHSDVLAWLIHALTDEAVAVVVAAIAGLVTRLQAGTVHPDWSRQQVIEQLVALLAHSDAHIRNAAAQALGDLDYRAGLCAVLDAAFVEGGHHANSIGQVLRQLDRTQSEALLLERLAGVSDSGQRRVVMELLAIVAEG